jgi:hypothetical protein
MVTKQKPSARAATRGGAKSRKRATATPAGRAPARGKKPAAKATKAKQKSRARKPAAQARPAPEPLPVLLDPRVHAPGKRHRVPPPDEVGVPHSDERIAKLRIAPMIVNRRG